MSNDNWRSNNPDGKKSNHGNHSGNDDINNNRNQNIRHHRNDYDDDLQKQRYPRQRSSRRQNVIQTSSNNLGSSMIANNENGVDVSQKYDHSQMETTGSNTNHDHNGNNNINHTNESTMGNTNNADQRFVLHNVFELCFDSGQLISQMPQYPEIFAKMDEWERHYQMQQQQSSRSILSSRFADEPPISVAVQIENGGAGDGNGNGTAAPTKKKKSGKSSNKRRASILDVLLNEKEEFRNTNSSEVDVTPVANRRPHIGRRTSIFDNLGLKKNMNEFIDEIRNLSNDNKTYCRQINAIFPRHEIRLIDVSYTVNKSVLKEFDYISPEEHVDVEEGRESFLTHESSHGLSSSTKLADQLDKVYRHFKFRLLNPCNLRSVEFEQVANSVLKGINLRFVSGKMYLVLGGAQSGKSTLLKAIAGILQEDRHHQLEGQISINKSTCKTQNLNWSNLVTFMDNHDIHLPRLTVKETVEFAWKCKSGGSHRVSGTPDTDEIERVVNMLDSSKWRVTSVLQGMGLTDVQNTLVGDENLRGVSGGERRRVTIAEVLSISTPIVCIDEMSTGLDAATTFDIVRLLSETVNDDNKIYIVSLLQPSPETFALFDECVVLDRGSVIFAGLVKDVLHHFHEIGYQLPPRMDLAEWLQGICQPEGGKYRTRKKTFNPHISSMLDNIHEWDISSDEDNINSSQMMGRGEEGRAKLGHLSNEGEYVIYLYLFVE